MDSCTVRRADDGDVAAVARLEQQCLGPDAWSEALVREGISGRLPTIAYLVAEVSGEVVGHAVCSSAGDIAELQRIAVADDHRRSGVATRLLAEAILLVDDPVAGWPDRMLLEVRPDNRAALAFYAAQGFVEIDRRTSYYADGADAVVMRRALGRGCGAGGTMER